MPVTCHYIQLQILNGYTSYDKFLPTINFHNMIDKIDYDHRFLTFANETMASYFLDLEYFKSLQIIMSSFVSLAYLNK